MDSFKVLDLMEITLSFLYIYISSCHFNTNISPLTIYIFFSLFLCWSNSSTGYVPYEPQPAGPGPEAKSTANYGKKFKHLDCGIMLG